jgi:hypothetical protein
LLEEKLKLSNENLTMQKEYAKLVGHNNHRQKIHHYEKLKEEHNLLKKVLI